MGRSWLSWNRLYIQAINSDDRGVLARFFDEACDEPAFFIRRRYIWNLIRGKEFYRAVADWVVDWYRAIDNDDLEGSILSAKDEVLDLIHRVITSEPRDNMKRSLVWKITKYAPILTVDTIPYISSERMRNILSSDKNIITDNSIDPFVSYISDLRIALSSAKSSIENISDLLLP